MPPAKRPPPPAKRTATPTPAKRTGPAPAPAPGSAAKRAAMRAKMIGAITKKFGKGAAVDLASEREAASQVKETLRTGIDVLDYYVLGSPEKPGFPIGRVSEVFGSEGSGKTSLGYTVAAAAQRQGGTACIIDVEFSFDPERAEVFGVDTDELMLVQPQNLEELYDELVLMLRTYDPSLGPLLIIWDSMAAVKPKKFVDGSAGDKTPGLVAAINSAELPKVLQLLAPARAHLMIINQTRVKFGVMFGDNTTTPGGNAPKFAASQRVSILGGKSIKNAKDEHTGKVVTVLAVKNRMTPPYRKARVRLDYGTGFNTVWSAIEHAKRMKAVTSRGYDLEVYAEAMEAMSWPIVHAESDLARQARALDVNADPSDDETDEELEDEEADEDEEEDD